MAKYTRELLEDAVRSNTSIIGVMRSLGISESSGGMHSHISSRITKLGIDTSHFKGTCWNKGMCGIGRAWQQILTYKRNGPKEKTRALRAALVASGRAEVCEICGLGPEWHGRKLVLQIDHKDGNNRNNVPGNVRFTCPNCHSQTPTYGKPKKLRV